MNRYNELKTSIRGMFERMMTLCSDNSRIEFILNKEDTECKVGVYAPDLVQRVIELTLGIIVQKAAQGSVHLSEENPDFVIHLVFRKVGEEVVVEDMTEKSVKVEIDETARILKQHELSWLIKRWDDKEFVEDVLLSEYNSTGDSDLVKIIDSL